MYYFGTYLFELTQLVPLPYSQVKSSCYFDRLHYFSVTIPRCYKDVYVNNFFLCTCTAKLWNFLPIKYFPLNYDLDGFKSRINRHLSSAGFFYRNLLFLYTFCTSFSYNSIPCGGRSTLIGVNPK